MYKYAKMNSRGNIISIKVFLCVCVFVLQITKKGELKVEIKKKWNKGHQSCTVKSNKCEIANGLHLIPPIILYGHNLLKP